MTGTTETRRPGAYAVSTESVGAPKFFSVTVPQNTEPGTNFTFSHDGQHRLTARCPPSCKPGDSLQVAISPPPETHHSSLKSAVLTTLQSEKHGGAVPMTSAIRELNRQTLEQTADTFVVQVPASVTPGSQFIAKTPKGERLLVTCPTNVQPGQRIRIHAPPTETKANNNTNAKVFQIKAPDDVKPNQVLPVLVCGRHIPVALPANVVPGQILNLNLPVNQVINCVELSYDDTTSKGWCRTIRMSDLKFQWVNNDVARDLEQQRQWKTSHSSFCRKLTFLEGNDPRMRAGTVELVSTSDVVAESELRHHHRTLISYATVAHIQHQSLDQKINWFQGLCGELTIPWESGRIKIVVRRDNILEDSVRSVMALSRADMRKRWRIDFFGEPAIDSGGVMREWFHLVTKQLYNPDLGLWLPSTNNQVCMRINPASDISCPDDHLIYFRFLGRFIGRALFDRQLIDGHMVRHIYKHLLGWPITFEDLQAQDEEYYNSLKMFTEMEDVSQLCLDFTVAEETMGVRRNVELIPGGKDIEVTAENLPQYLEAILRYRMLDRTKLQITELLLGFFDVVPEPALTVFDPSELELILNGVPVIDIDDWEKNTIYNGDCAAGDDVVKWFWEVVRDEFDQEMRARLLQFVTGTAGVPSQGFSVLQGNDGNIKLFCLNGVSRSSYAYPRAHTCFNRMDLPTYTAKEELLERLKESISYAGVTFDME
eukprot:Nitzschia sp. Nitz4//scaffold265_size26576//8993//11333//NITZ4_008247-RA/size26576-augustus-gene-0.21-mRNA-1//-1//CDS//3329544837//4446//frame0